MKIFLSEQRLDNFIGLQLNWFVLNGTESQKSIAGRNGEKIAQLLKRSLLSIRWRGRNELLSSIGPGNESETATIQWKIEKPIGFQRERATANERTERQKSERAEQKLLRPVDKQREAVHGALAATVAMTLL